MGGTKKLSKFIVDGTRSSSRKCALTDNIKISEPKKSIATGPLYVHTEFETNWTLLPEDVAVSNLMAGNQVSQRRHGACVRHENTDLHTEILCYEVLKIKSIAFTVRKL